jgi:hypothetical protein
MQPQGVFFLCLSLSVSKCLFKQKSAATYSEQVNQQPLLQSGNPPPPDMPAKNEGLLLR